jgi:hypothetical protein
MVKPFGNAFYCNAELFTQLLFLKFCGIIGNFVKKLVQNVHLFRRERRPNAKKFQESLKTQKDEGLVAAKGLISFLFLTFPSMDKPLIYLFDGHL